MSTDDEPDVEANLLVKLAKKFLPLHSSYVGTHFLTKIDGRTFMTPLMIVLLMVESADVVFAVDSIPAIFSITRDPFIIFTSNVFAILGLRSLYFALAGVMHRFKYVKAALVFVLAFIGVKMLLAHFYHLDPYVSLSAIVAMLCVGVLASVVADRRQKARAEAPFGPEVSELARLAIKKGRRLVILVFGLTLLLIAIPIGLLPGPGGLLVAAAGLAILAIEFVWARLLLRRVKSEAQAMAEIAASIVGIQSKTHPHSDPNLDPDDLMVRKAYSRLRLILLTIAAPFSMRASNERAKLIEIRKAHGTRKAARSALAKGFPAPDVSHEEPVETSTTESRL
jgi:tellurite resistance protein TerC